MRTASRPGSILCTKPDVVRWGHTCSRARRALEQPLAAPWAAPRLRRASSIRRVLPPSFHQQLPSRRCRLQRRRAAALNACSAASHDHIVPAGKNEPASGNQRQKISPGAMSNEMVVTATSTSCASKPASAAWPAEISRRSHVRSSRLRFVRSARGVMGTQIRGCTATGGIEVRFLLIVFQRCRDRWRAPPVAAAPSEDRIGNRAPRCLRRRHVGQGAGGNAGSIGTKAAPAFKMPSTRDDQVEGSAPDTPRRSSPIRPRT